MQEHANYPVMRLGCLKELPMASVERMEYIAGYYDGNAAAHDAKNP